MTSGKKKKDMPGPANYTLPPTIGCMNADFTKIKYPCYTIGNRQPTKWETFGPGPAIYHPGKCTRFGVDERSTHVGTRLKELKTFETPAPNAYDLPEIIGERRVSNAYQKRTPAYVFGIKPKQLGIQQVPPPTAYDIPPTIGVTGMTVGFRAAPSYTMGNVLKTSPPFLTPSPAHYFPQPNNDRKILPSIKPRIKNLKTFDTPGPNTYNLQAHQPGARSPAFSIRQRIEWRFFDRMKCAGQQEVRVLDCQQKKQIFVKIFQHQCLSRIDSKNANDKRNRSSFSLSLKME